VALGRRRPVATAVAQVGALVAAFYLVPLDRSGWIGVLIVLVTVVGLLPYALYNARVVVASDRPFADAMRAAALLLTGLIVGFACGYYAMARHAPGQMEGIGTKTDAIYFTVTVVSTVGFGDIVPTGQAARVLASVQMIFDLAFLALGLRLLTHAIEGSRGPGGPLRRNERSTASGAAPPPGPPPPAGSSRRASDRSP
jgi:hypothetical protein